MQKTIRYQSPLGTLVLTANQTGLTKLCFCENSPYAETNPDSTILERTKHWLDLYFSGKNPGPVPPVHLTGSPFQTLVWGLLQDIPYGQTVSYGELARQVAVHKGETRMSAQAVGGAVGRNPVAILVPCHRVVGADGSLTGYAGGIEKKAGLLTLEGVRILGGKIHAV